MLFRSDHAVRESDHGEPGTTNERTSRSNPPDWISQCSSVRRQRVPKRFIGQLADRHTTSPSHLVADPALRGFGQTGGLSPRSGRFARLPHRINTRIATVQPVATSEEGAAAPFPSETTSPPQRKYKGGNKNRFRIVDVTSPPTMTTARGYSISCPEIGRAHV